MDEKIAREFFLVTSYTAQFPVTKTNFRSAWAKVKHLDLFNWLPNLILGYLEKNLNLEPENEVKGYERRLSVQSREK